MNKKLILTSILAIGVTGAAHAATNTGSFPNDGKMLEDWTYTNAANETNVGTDGGNVNALANYTWNEIALPAGKYLPADTDGIAANLETCTAGNYCAGTGANTVHYNQSQAQGLTECPSEYGNSAVGSTADTDCYRTCDINNMTTTSNPNGTIANIAHAATLTGNDYYGNGTDTCEPATCETGYQVNPGNQGALATCVPKTYNITWADTLPADVTANEAGTATYGGNINTPVKIDPAVFQTTQKGKRFIGWTFGAPKYDYSQLDYTIPGYGNTYDDITYRTWTTTFDYGTISGVSLCSVTPGDDYAATGTPDETTTGEEAHYCWCKATGYTPAGENIVYENTSSSPWVFLAGARFSASDCAGTCTDACGADVGSRDDPDLRRVLFGITND